MADTERSGGEFEDIISDISFDEMPVDISVSPQCRTCPWIDEAKDDLRELVESSRNSTEAYAYLVDPHSSTRAELEQIAEMIAETLSNETDVTHAEILGLAIELTPKMTAEQIVQCFLEVAYRPIEENEAQERAMRKNIATAMARCAGPLVWHFVESPTGGAIVEMVCDAPKNAFDDDDDNHSERAVSYPRRLTEEEWTPLREQTRKLRRG